MKKYTIGLLSVLALVAITTAPTSAATSSGAVKPATAAEVKCNKQADFLAKVPTDLDFFKATYYTLPNSADVTAHYPSVVKKGSKTPVPTAIYKGAEPKNRAGKTNYALVAQRFHNTQTYFSSIVLKGTSTPALDQGNLAKLIAANNVVDASVANHAAAIDAVKAAYPIGIYDCATVQNRTIVAKKYNAERASVKKLTQDIVIVRNKTKDARNVYQTLEAQRAKLVRQHKI